jgi:hypothetical protein
LRGVSGRKRLLRSLSPRRAKPNGSANVRAQSLLQPSNPVRPFTEVIFQPRPESRRFCQAPSGPRTLVGSICPNSVVPTRTVIRRGVVSADTSSMKFRPPNLTSPRGPIPKMPARRQGSQESRTRARARAAMSRGILRKTRPTQVCHSPSQSLFSRCAGISSASQSLRRTGCLDTRHLLTRGNGQSADSTHHFASH